ncbi:hypothetical protein RUM43_012620 [Polyplax serrata]|uniref:Uncharacterized protein n=1 Tax=Polyplax serrata TaxID=468196 RepID=A0AAN8S763_POLSC
MAGCGNVPTAHNPSGRRTQPTLLRWGVGGERGGGGGGGDWRAKGQVLRPVPGSHQKTHITRNEPREVAKPKEMQPNEANPRGNVDIRGALDV